MFEWTVKEDIKAANAIFLGETREEEGRPFKARFLQAGLVKYDFGVCLLKKETIDKFVNTFIECPVIINHKDDISKSDKKGVVKNIWFSPEDSWFWCSGYIDEDAVEKVEDGFNVSCQYRITEYSNNDENKLHNGNPYDKEILNGVFEHLAIVKNPRYEDAYIAVNAIMATNEDQWITIGADEESGRKGKHILVREGQTKEEAAKESMQAQQQFRDKMSVIPFGQPIHGDRDRRYREKAWDTLGRGVKLQEKSDYYASKAGSVGKAGISADDANAIAKLTQKYKSRVDSAEKRRIIDRVIDLYNRKNSDKPSTEDYSDLGFNVERNTDKNRLQLKFNNIPDASTRQILKSNGFRWSPSEGAWQRQLNSNSEYSLKYVVEKLKASNEFIEEFKDALYTCLAEGIYNRLGS